MTHLYKPRVKAHQLHSGLLLRKVLHVKWSTLPTCQGCCQMTRWEWLQNFVKIQKEHVSVQPQLLNLPENVALI